MEIKEFIVTIHNDARENSINGQKIEKNIKKKKMEPEQLKQKIKTTIISLALIASGFAANELVQAAEDNSIISEYLSNNRSIVTENTRRTEDNNGYFYLHNNIAYEIAISEQDIDAVIYAVYNKMSYDRIGNMDYVMRELRQYVPTDSRFKNISSFTAYLKQNGFVTESGEIDMDTAVLYILVLSFPLVRMFSAVLQRWKDANQ